MTAKVIDIKLVLSLHKSEVPAMRRIYYSRTGESYMPNTKKELCAEAVISELEKRGVIGKGKSAADKKDKTLYHNTKLLLQHYRTISWLLECFPDSIAAELEQPFSSLDIKLYHRKYRFFGARGGRARCLAVESDQIYPSRTSGNNSHNYSSVFLSK